MASIEKHGNLWRGVYRAAEGRKHKTKGHKTKRAAKAEADDAEGAIRRGEWQSPQKGAMTFGTYYLHHWLPQRRLELNTYAWYLSSFNAELNARWGEVPLAKITRRDVQMWVNEMATRRSPRSVKGHYGALATCLDAQRGVSAVRDGLLVKSPCKGIDLPVRVDREVDIYLPEEYQRILEACPQWWRPMVITCAESGLRLGELLGLQVGDLDENNVLHVRRTVIEVAKSLTENGDRLQRKPFPKSKRTRKIELWEGTAEMLREMARERRLFGNDRMFSMPDGQGSVVRTENWPDGLPVSRHYWDKSIWGKRLFEKAGVERRRFYDLRGSHFSWLLHAGVDLTTVQERAGHRSLETTMRYIAAPGDAQKRALRGLNQTLGRTPPPDIAGGERTGTDNEEEGR